MPATPELPGDASAKRSLPEEAEPTPSFWQQLQSRLIPVRRPRRSALPKIRLQGSVASAATMLVPRSDPVVQALDVHGRRVAVGLYAVSPLSRFLYIYRLEVPPELRGQGYGMAMVDLLWREHRLVLRPIYVAPGSIAFWKAVQRRGIPVELGGAVTALPGDGGPMRLRDH